MGVKMIDVTSEIEKILEKYGIQEEETLQNTPKRVSKAISELWRGLYEPLPNLAFFQAKKGMTIKVEKISFVSTCEHHLMPFFGDVEIIFQSSGWTLGLSKFNRLVQHLAAKPTIQEKLCREIFDIINKNISPDYLKVIVKAKHTCVAFRGVKDSCSDTTTILEEHFS